MSKFIAEHKCKFGSSKQDIRCECGGQLASSGTIHPLADLSISAKGVEGRYSKKVIGYSGFCLS